jgi:hypothetical protein
MDETSRWESGQEPSRRKEFVYGVNQYRAFERGVWHAPGGPSDTVFAYWLDTCGGRELLAVFGNEIESTGLRYWLRVGRGFCLGAGKTRSHTCAKCLKMVHAV